MAESHKHEIEVKNNEIRDLITQLAATKSDKAPLHESVQERIQVEF